LGTFIISAYFNCLYTVLQLPCNIADEVLSYYWHYPHSMRRKVYKTVQCPSVRLSHSPAGVACGGFAAANIDAIQHGIYFHSVIVHQYTNATSLIHTIQMSIQNVLKTFGCELNGSYNENSACPASSSLLTYMSSCTETHY